MRYDVDKSRGFGLGVMEVRFLRHYGEYMLRFKSGRGYKGY